MTLPVKVMEFPLPITLGISHFGERDNFLYSQDGGKSGQDSEARIDPKCGISGHARGEQAWPTRESRWHGALRQPEHCPRKTGEDFVLCTKAEVPEGNCSGHWIAYSFLRYLLSTYCVPYSRGQDKIVNKVDKFPVLMELSFAFPSSFFF